MHAGGSARGRKTRDDKKMGTAKGTSDAGGRRAVRADDESTFLDHVVDDP